MRLGVGFPFDIVLWRLQIWIRFDPPVLGELHGILRDSLFLLCADAIPMGSHVFVSKDLSNLFERSAFRLLGISISSIGLVRR